MPWPSGLVVKNGSKMRGRTSAGMPCPVSATERNTNFWRRRRHVRGVLPIGAGTRADEESPTLQASRRGRSGTGSAAPDYLGRIREHRGEHLGLLHLHAGCAVERATKDLDHFADEVRAGRVGFKLRTERRDEAEQLLGQSRRPVRGFFDFARRRGVLDRMGRAPDAERPRCSMMTVSRLLKSWAMPPAS